MSWITLSSKSALAGSFDSPWARANAGASRQLTRTTAAVSRLQDELQANDSAPERGAIWYRITFDVFHMFPDPVDLDFDEAVNRPIHPQCHRAIAGRQDRLRARTAKRVVCAADAVEHQPLVTRGELHRTPSALQELASGLDR